MYIKHCMLYTNADLSMPSSFTVRASSKRSKMAQLSVFGIAYSSEHSFAGLVTIVVHMRVAHMRVAHMEVVVRTDNKDS